LRKDVYIFIVMCNGKLVKLKQSTQCNYSTDMGSMPLSIENDTTYGIILCFYSHNGTYEVLLDGEVCFNVYPDSLEAVI